MNDKSVGKTRIQHLTNGLSLRTDKTSKLILQNALIGRPFAIVLILLFVAQYDQIFLRIALQKNVVKHDKQKVLLLFLIKEDVVNGRKI